MNGHEIAALVRQGRLSHERVAAAAGLFHAGALGDVNMAIENKLGGAAPNVELARGMHLVMAVSHLVQAASLYEQEHSFAVNVSSVAISVASKSAHDLLGEMTWQLERITAALLTADV